MKLACIPTGIEIKGFQENSLIDWEGKIVSIIFLPFCNFRCPFCHAVELVTTPDVLETVPVEEVKKYFAKARGWIDGLVICGGEPTLYPELPEFIRQFKKMGVPVKLDTNGSNSRVLKKLIDENLLAYVAMDIKAPLEKYSETSGVTVDTEEILKSIEILKEEKIDYEFRTTVVPAFLQEADIEEISKLIAGSRYYILQQFAPRKTLQPHLTDTPTFSKEELEKMAGVASRYVKKVSVRAA